MGQKLTWRTDQSVVKDSINEYPIDSVCLHKAVHLTNGLQNFISNFASLGNPIKYTKKTMAAYSNEWVAAIVITCTWPDAYTLKW